MLQLENSGILAKIEDLFAASKAQDQDQDPSALDPGDPMLQMKICIKASERLSGTVDRLQRFIASCVYPLFPELESLVHSKDQFIKCLDRMIKCANPETINLGGD